VSHKHLRDDWYARKRAIPISAELIFTPEGLVLGEGTVIVAAVGSRRLQSLRGQEARVLALLSAACGKAVAPSVLAKIERATKAWSDGDNCLAYVHLAHTCLRPFQDFCTGPYRLFMAHCALSHGASPRDVFKALHLDPRYIDSVEKDYNPAQPRVPAGSGRTSGEWTDGEWTDGEEASDGLPNETVGNGTAQEAASGADTSGSSLLSRAPLVDPKASFLGELTVEQVAELAAYAWRVLRIATPIGGAAAVFGLLFVPSANDIHIEGDVPDIPGLRYSWNRDENQLRLIYDEPGGTQRTFAAYLDDEYFRDDNGRIVGRVIGGNKIVLDTIAILPDLVKQDEPRLCPAPAPDVAGSDQGKPYEENRARQYEDFVKRLINLPPLGPTPSGFVYYLPNPEKSDAPVSYDDCQQPAGTMLFEIKAEQYTKLLNSWWAGPKTVKTMLGQSLRQVQASGGRPVVWIVGEEGADTIRGWHEVRRDARCIEWHRSDLRRVADSRFSR
jgi:hypothetical protein